MSLLCATSQPSSEGWAAGKRRPRVRQWRRWPCCRPRSFRRSRPMPCEPCDGASECGGPSASPTCDPSASSIYHRGNETRRSGRSPSIVLGLAQVIRLAAEADGGAGGPARLRPPGQAGASVRLEQLFAARAPPVGRHPYFLIVDTGDRCLIMRYVAGRTRATDSVDGVDRFRSPFRRIMFTWHPPGSVSPGNLS